MKLAGKKKSKSKSKSIYDGYKKKGIEEELIFGATDDKLGAKDTGFDVRNEIIKNQVTLSLTDIYVVCHDENSYSFYGLHKMNGERDRNKCEALMNRRLDEKYKFLTQLSDEKKQAQKRANKDFVATLKYAWISTLIIVMGKITLLSAGVSNVKDGQKLLGTCIDYLKAESNMIELGIQSPNKSAIPFYTQMGFIINLSENNMTPLDKLNSDLNILYVLKDVEGREPPSKRLRVDSGCERRRIRRRDSGGGVRRIRKSSNKKDGVNAKSIVLKGMRLGAQLNKLSIPNNPIVPSSPLEVNLTLPLPPQINYY